MILDKTVNVKINNSTKKHFKDLNYKVNINDIINIPIDHLMLTSHQLINVKCDICGIEKKLQYRRYLLSFNNGGYYACSKCQKIKINEIIKEKYGCENVFQNEDIKDKIKETNLKKYGVDHPQKSLIVRNKTKSTNKEKYGCENVFQNEDIKDKIKEINLEKYGFERPSCNIEIKNKISKSVEKTCIEKYGESSPFKVDLFKKKSLDVRRVNDNLKRFKKYFNLIDYDNHFYTFVCEKNHIFKIKYGLLFDREKMKTIICTICNPIHSAISGYEIQLRYFIKENYEGEIIYNNRKVIPPLELDIYLPDLNLAFEFNGTYWHSELYKDKNYHDNKINKCKEKDITLVHVWEEDWTKNRDEIKTIILKSIKQKMNV